MTVQDKFEKYLSDHLNINDGDIKKIQVHKELRKKLKERLAIKGEVDDETYSFLTGSYIRSTSIRPPKDIDFFIVLNEDEYGDKTPVQVLNLLEETLRNIDEEKTIFQQSHSVTIEYDEEFSIDVIPAFEDGADYKIPNVSDGQSSWLKSNPKVHQEVLTKANEDTNGNLVPIVKLLKSWKRDKCDYVKSFHLELLVTEIIKGTDTDRLSEGIARFFNEATGWLNESCIKDPANSSNYVDDYLSAEERKKFKSLIISEKNISNHAIELEEDGNEDDAITEWNKIFVFNPDRKKYISKTQPHERQLSYPDNIQYKIKVTCKLYNFTKGIYKDNYYSGSRKLPKGWKLRFKVETTHIPTPASVYWQVVNTGKEAEDIGDLRGELMQDQGFNRRDEHTKYSGTHYMNCFVVKNSQCLAKDRFYVQIG